jgi:tetratricopeptide (TPR) repeat protein
MLAALAGVTPARAQVEVSASLDRTQLAIGETALLDLKIDGAQNAPAPALGNVGGFSVRYIGPATQMTIVNGRMSSSVSHRYQLTANAAGRFTVGPFEVDVDGTSYRTQPIAVEVSQQAPDNRGGGANLRLELRTDRTSVFVGEKLPVTVKLLVGQGTRVEDLQYPVISAEGAVIDKPSEPAQRDEVIGGRRYRTLYFETKVTPLRSGTVSLGASIGLSVVVPQRGRQGFGGLFGDAFGERRARELQAEVTLLEVRALPAEGRPPGFSGAVGTFTFDVEASPRDLQEGDPVTVRMRIAGDGDLSKVGPPRLEARDDLRTYDPLPAKDTAEGERVFEQVVIPLRAGPTDLPALRFSYFDPQQERYQTIERGPIPLVVRASAAARPPGVVSSEAAPAPVPRAGKSLGRDIVFIKEAPGRWRGRGRGLSEGALLWLAQVPPLALLGVVVIVVRRRELFAANPRLRRFHAAGVEARRGLAELEKLSRADDFYDRLAAVVGGYLSAKLDLPPGAVEGARVAARLREIGAAEGPATAVTRFFDLVQAVRYAAAGGGEAERSEALVTARGIVDALERERRIEGWMMRTLTALALLLLAASASLRPAMAVVDAGAVASPGSAFFAGNASYAAGDYAAAARSYEAILADGVESGAVLFNLGNAYFKSGETARAIANYMRAERLLPRDPDVAVNLAYAREVARVETPPDPLWWRVLFAAAYRLAGAELSALAALVWWLACGFYAARLLRPAQAIGWGRAAWLCGALAVYLFAALAYRNAHLELHDVAVVTADKETVVRFEPSDSGTQHFAAAPGTALTVTDRHEGWLQVSAADGRRGWIPVADLTLLR